MLLPLESTEWLELALLAEWLLWLCFDLSGSLVQLVQLCFVLALLVSCFVRLEQGLFLELEQQVLLVQ